MKHFLTALLSMIVISAFGQIDVAQNGRVGIGISTPSSLLHINGNAPVLKLQNSQHSHVSPNYFGYIVGTDVNGDNTWWVGEGTSNAKIVGLYNTQPGYLLNLYNNNKGITVREDGNVGIGTNSPDFALTIFNKQKAFEIYNSSASTDDAHMRFHWGSNAWYSMGIDNSDGGKFKINYGQNIGSADHLTITTGGNIGIGTTNPSEILELNDGSSTALKLSTTDPNYGLTFTANHDYNNRFSIRYGATVPMQERKISDLAGDSAGGSKLFFSNYYGMGFATDTHDLNATNTDKIALYISGPTDTNGPGNVGIGTSTPSTRLNLKTNISNAQATILKLDNSGTAGNVTGLEFFASATDSNTSNRVGRIEGLFDGGSFTDARLSFYSMTTGNTLVETLNLQNGNVGIGTVDTFGYRLAVDGTIGSDEMFVHDTVNFPDYVFESNYQLLSLTQVEEHIKEKGHLPNIPSAKEIEEKGGFSLGEMNKKLLEKVEELTLHLIEQNKQIKQQKEQFKKQDERIKALERELKTRKK